MSTFEVGEVAIYNNPNCPLHGEECTITEGLGVRECWVYPAVGAAAQYTGYREGYRIWFASVASYDLVAFPYELRKRRPPQDWITICNLREDTVERPKEVA